MSQAVSVGGHTRWGRAIIALIPALAAVLLLAVGLFTKLAATVALGGMSIDIGTSSLSAQNAALYGNARSVVGGEDLQVITAGIETAELQGLCAAVEVPVPIAGGFNIMLRADDSVTVDGGDLALDLVGLEGSLAATNLQVGPDAAQYGGHANSDAILADTLEVGGADVDAMSLAAGNISLSNIGISIASRDTGC